MEIEEENRDKFEDDVEEMRQKALSSDSCSKEILRQEFEATINLRYEHLLNMLIQGKNMASSTIQTYIKKAIAIQAVKLDKDNAKEVTDWCRGVLTTTINPTDDGGMDLVVSISINTLEGKMWVREGDYIIKGVADEFYPCKSGIFDSTYDLVPIETNKK